MMGRIDERAFDGRRLKAPGRWLVCFAASWCGFCREFLESFELLQDNGEVELAVADVSRTDSRLWREFELETIPTLAAFRDGECAGRRNGLPGMGLEPSDVRVLWMMLREKVPR